MTQPTTALASRRTAGEIAGRVAGAAVGLVVLVGTTLAWLGVNLLGGTLLGDLPLRTDSPSTLTTDLLTTAAVIALATVVLTVLMAVVWRPRATSAWFVALLCLLGLQVFFGVIALVASLAHSDLGPAPGDSGAVPGDILSTVGALLPVALCALACLTAARVLFRTRRPWVAGVLTSAIQVAALAVFVAVVVATA